jgi:hypothetical protein
MNGMEPVEGLGAVPCDLDAKPLPLQADGERLDKRLLVLDDEDRRPGVGRQCRHAISAARALRSPVSM